MMDRKLLIEIFAKELAEKQKKRQIYFIMNTMTKKCHPFYLMVL